MVDGYGLKFGIIVAEVDDHFGEPWLQICDRIPVKLFPLVCVHRGICHDDGVYDDVFFGKLRKKLRWIPGDSRRQKGQMIFMSHSDENREEFGLSKEHSHVTVKVRGMNSCSYGAFNLRANLTLRLFGFEVLYRRPRFRPRSTQGWRRQRQQFGPARR